jgi:hypothetical protein
MRPPMPRENSSRWLRPDLSAPPKYSADVEPDRRAPGRRSDRAQPLSAQEAKDRIRGAAVLDVRQRRSRLTYPRLINIGLEGQYVSWAEVFSPRTPWAIVAEEVAGR